MPHRTGAKPASRKVVSSNEDAPDVLCKRRGILYFAEGLPTTSIIGQQC
jgi:hypothetical protein